MASLLLLPRPAGLASQSRVPVWQRWPPRLYVHWSSFTTTFSFELSPTATICECVTLHGRKHKHGVDAYFKLYTNKCRHRTNSVECQITVPCRNVWASRTDIIMWRDSDTRVQMNPAGVGRLICVSVCLDQCNQLKFLQIYRMVRIKGFWEKVEFLSVCVKREIWRCSLLPNTLLTADCKSNLSQTASTFPPSYTLPSSILQSYNTSNFPMSHFILFHCICITFFLHKSPYWVSLFACLFFFVSSPDFLPLHFLCSYSPFFLLSLYLSLSFSLYALRFPLSVPPSPPHSNSMWGIPRSHK